MSGRAATFRAGRRLEADVGHLEAAWEPRQGGRLAVRAGALAASLDVRVDGRTPRGRLDLRQSLDVQPTLLPLEEGPERVAVRSLWSLVDADGVAYGDALQDVVATRHGEIFLALALRIVGPRDLVVEHAALHLELDGAQQTVAADSELVARAHNDVLIVRLPSGRGRRTETLFWQQSHAPYYERWPPLFDQWSLDPETFGWSRFHGAGASVQPHGPAGAAAATVAWIDGATVKAAPQLDLRGLLWLGLGAESRIRALSAAHERPLVPEVVRGRLRGYEELDGAYEVAVDGDDTCALEFPPDPLQRPLRVRCFGLEATGGFDGAPSESLLLLSERGRTDDPLVWVDVAAEGRADEALVTTTASAERPTRIAIRPRDGLHVAYQRRDPRRRLTVHHPRDLDVPVASFDLAALHLRGVRRPGSDRPAIYDTPLFWMRYLPKATAHRAEQLTGWEIVESSPDRVSLVFESTTADARVRSRYRIDMPYRPDRVELRIQASLEGAAAWGIPTFEYADLFPEDGIDPSRWEYDRLAFVSGETVVSIDPRRPFPSLDENVSFPAHVLDVVEARIGLPDCGPWRFGRSAAIVLGGSARGTIVAIASNPQPEALEHVVTLCEHWCDVHFDAAALGATTVASETSARSGSGDAPVVPDEIRGELTLCVLDPDSVSFADAVAEARAAVEKPCSSDAAAAASA